MVDRVEPGWMRMVISGGVGVMGDRADVALGRRTQRKIGAEKPNVRQVRRDSKIVRALRISDPAQLRKRIARLCRKKEKLRNAEGSSSSRDVPSQHNPPSAPDPTDAAGKDKEESVDFEYLRIGIRGADSKGAWRKRKMARRHSYTPFRNGNNKGRSFRKESRV